MQTQLDMTPGILAALHPSDELPARLLELNFKACKLIMRVEASARQRALRNPPRSAWIYTCCKSHGPRPRRAFMRPALLLFRQVDLQLMHFQTGTLL